MKFFSDCVSWPRDDVNNKGGLCEMIGRNKDITRRTFLKHVDRSDLKQIEQALGYCRGGLMMASDWAVSYHRSKLHGKPVYYFRHSAIEYVFAP